MRIARRKMIKSFLAAPFVILSGEAKAETAENVFPKICATCRHYEPLVKPRFDMLLDDPLDSFCRHPGSMQWFYPYDKTVRNLGLHREPGDSCRRYEKIVFEA